jgi:hypothetical protein
LGLGLHAVYNNLEEEELFTSVHLGFLQEKGHVPSRDINRALARYINIFISY